MSASPSFDLETPDHFTAGAVGQPGQRVFYFQARQSTTLVTLKAEKEQVGALAEYLAGLLARLASGGEATPRDTSLLEPIVEAWAVGTVGVGYNEPSDRIVILLDERMDEEDEPEGAEDADATEGGADATEGGADATEGGADAAEGAESAERASARFHITRAQAAAFVERARALMKAGRPLCAMCRRPKDPEGHHCPESNGHRAG